MKIKSMQAIVIPLMLLGLSMSANAFFERTEGWKEEVALHDGSKLIVKRTHTFASFTGIGHQRPAIIGKTIEFVIPGTSKTIAWQNNKSQRFLSLLALDFTDGVPYLVTNTGDCPTHNEFGRPNPPYLFYKLDFDSSQWNRITVEEFPSGFDTNLIIDTKSINEATWEEESRLGFISAATGHKLNVPLPAYLRHIVRTPITYGRGGPSTCPIMDNCFQGSCTPNSYAFPK